MSRQADEDAIEATIRRVAEAKAAREGRFDDDQDADEAPSPSEPGALADEDAIEATIRRVAEAKAARGGRFDDDDADAADAPPPSEPAAQLGQTAEPAGTLEPAPASDPLGWPAAMTIPPSRREHALDVSPETDDLIEETIRRVAEAKAAREAPAAPAMTPVEQRPAFRWGPGDSPEAAPVPTPIRPDQMERHEPEPQVTKAADEGTSDLVAAVGRLEREVADMRRDLSTLHGRVNALESSMARPSPAPAPAAIAARTQQPLPRQPLDEEWDERPKVSTAGFGAPPRPAIFRDPSPQTATAEQLIDAEPDEYEGEPVAASIPEPRPAPTPVRARSGMDLLPRTYRITVEDKRGGVDLVPLHRALLAADAITDMSLLSYNNGVAIVSLDAAGPIEPDDIGRAVAQAMRREVEVEVHNEQTMVVRIAED